MRKTTQIISLLFVTVALSSCGFYEQKQRKELYLQVTATNDSLDKMTKGWHTLLDRAVRSKNFSGLHAARIELGQYLSRRRSVIANLELPPDAETLRGSEDMYLSTQVAMVTDIYPQFEMFNELTPDSSIQNRRRLVFHDLETEVSWNLTIKKLLDAFVVKHRIKITKK